MIAANTSRRTSRSRVWPTGDSSPPATAVAEPLPRRERARSTISRDREGQDRDHGRRDLVVVVAHERGAVEVDDRHGLPGRRRPRGVAGLRRHALAILVVAIFAALSRRPCDRRPAGRDAAAASTTPRSRTRSAGSATRCCRRSRAGTRSGTCGSPTPATTAASARRRSSRSTRCSLRGVGELGGGSAGALLVAAYLVSLAAFVGRARAPAPAHRARARTRAGPRRRCC